MILRERWCSLEMGLQGKFGDGNSGSLTTSSRPVTRLDLNAVPAWEGERGGHRHVVGRS